jgi:hypothetical protein
MSSSHRPLSPITGIEVPRRANDQYQPKILLAGLNIATWHIRVWYDGSAVLRLVGGYRSDNGRTGEVEVIISLRRGDDGTCDRWVNDRNKDGGRGARRDVDPCAKHLAIVCDG